MSARYLGGVIAQTQLPLNPAAGNAANGVFTLEQYMQAVKNATWPGFDPYFNQTTLLLHGNGTNGAQNNTFLDSGTANGGVGFTITRNGNTTQGTFSPFSLAAGEWSNYFDGTNDFLTTPSNSAFDFGTGDFTVEFWAYVQTTSGFTAFVGTSTGDATSTIRWRVYIDSTSSSLTTELYNTSNASIGFIIFQSTFPRNQWVHCALVRNGTSFRLYQNGVQSSSSITSSAAVANSSTVVRVGDFDGSIISDLNGYMSNLRIVKGTAVYTSAFTPPTTPLTNITNTSLLTCQSNRFVDNSTANSGTGFTITRNGDVRVTPFSPFAPTAAYSAGTNGGSGYFDGNTDYLSTPSNAAFTLSGDFTIEAWVYRTVAGVSQGIFTTNPSVTNTGVALVITSGNVLSLRIGPDSSVDVLSDPNTFPLNAWTHCAATRSGNNLTLYKNGVSVNTTTTSKTPNTTTGVVGRFYSDVDNFYLTGYISGLKVIKGSAVAPSGVPTSPPVDSSGTSLLLNFTNAGIFDNTGKNNLETVGNAQIDTAVKKYGTGSLEFDGSGDCLIVPSSVDTTLGLGDFTIEFWFYTATSQTGNLFDQRSTGTQVTPVLYLNSGVLIYYVNLGARITGSSVPTNQWNHVAVCRAGTSTKMFLNGVQTGSTYTDSNNYVAAPIGIGAYPVDVSSPFNGYIDDLRITKGVARYTANFTPQTSQWQDQ